MDSTHSLQPSPRLALTVVLLGLAAMYLPTYWWAATGIWQTDGQAHGALILLIVVWLFWRQREAFLAAAPVPAPALGWPILIIGLLLYVIGRSQDVSILELGSQVPVVLGSVLIIGGRPAIRAVWFPILYISFMVPLPGTLVDAATGPLKQWISIITESVLYATGHPIARSGVTLVIGQYQLLVADACSGLHSMFSLSALGVLFMYLTARESRVHNAVMLVSILPIAFVANLIRVMVLVLITYYLGDEAGQGFLHGAAGIVLIVVALMCLLTLDAGLARAIRQKSNR